MRARTLDGVHDTAPLEHLVESHTSQQSLRALLDHLRDEIAREQNDERAKERGHELAEHREAVLEAFGERGRHGDVGGTARCRGLLREAQGVGLKIQKHVEHNGQEGAGHGRAWVQGDGGKLVPCVGGRYGGRFGGPTSWALEPSAPLPVIHDASTAGGTEEPLTLAMIAKPERSAANLAVRHADGAAGAHGGLASHRRVAQCPLLVRGKPGGLAHSRITTFPNCAPVSSRSNACRPSSSDQTESTGGCSAPVRNSAVIAANSASLPMVDPMIVH